MNDYALMILDKMVINIVIVKILKKKKLSPRMIRAKLKNKNLSRGQHKK